MTLRELEYELRYLRTNVVLRMIYDNSYRLQFTVIKNIENGGNYLLKSLMCYLDALGYWLFINGKRVEKLPDIGAILKNIREEASIPINKMKHPVKRLRDLKKIEDGTGGSRANLTLYIEALEEFNINLDFKLEDKYGLRKERK